MPHALKIKIAIGFATGFVFSTIGAYNFAIGNSKLANVFFILALGNVLLSLLWLFIINRRTNKS